MSLGRGKAQHVGRRPKLGGNAIHFDSSRLSTDQPEIADYLFVNALENERGPRIFRIGRSSIIAADIEALRDESNSADHIGRTPDTPPKSAELSYGVVR